uniref:Fumarate lyase N-terminal domain-containing protein n=1 Tax=Ditylenchus dipsaci TaxID=166011 RepID=A0A915CZ84_9BILA
MCISFVKISGRTSNVVKHTVWVYKISDAYSTGSSIMPQKRNADAAELIRAKTGRINGNLVCLLTVLKALPLSYSKDLQEDKECLFDTADNLMLMLKTMTGMFAGMSINKEQMKEAAGAGFSTATDWQIG